MWVYFSREVSKDYVRKFRQIQTALKNDDNGDLRQQLVTKAIDAMTAVTFLKADMLVPAIKKQKIAEDQKKNFETKVIINEGDIGVVTKTDSGLEYVEKKEAKAVE